MVLDARLEVFAQINGTDMPVISGSTSDSFLENSGWVLTSGQLVLSGTITAPLGALCRLSYRSSAYAGAMPRPRLRVLRCTPDPMRRTTTVELGCLLSLYLNKSAPPLAVTQRIDFDSPNYYFIDSAANFVRYGLDQAGVRYTGLPDLNGSILKDWSWRDGYLNKIGDILQAFNYFGYVGPDEVVRFQSLSSPSLSGPSLNLEDLIDITPLTGGTRPGRTIYGRGSYYGYPFRSADEIFDEDEFTLDGTDTNREWGTETVRMPMVESVGCQEVTRREVEFTRSSTNSSTFDRYGKILYSEETTYDHCYNLNSAHPEECHSFAAKVSPLYDREGNETIYKQRGHQALSGIRDDTLIGSYVRVDYEYESVEVPEGWWSPNEEEGAEARAEYARRMTAARVVRQTTTRSLPEMAVRGSTGLKYLYLDPVYDYNGRKTGEVLVDIGPGSSELIPVEKTIVETFYDNPTAPRTMTTRILYGPTSQQGAAGSAAVEPETSAEALSYLETMMAMSRAEVTHSTSATNREGQEGTGDSAQQFQPSTAPTWVQVAVNSEDTVADTYQFYDCPVTFALLTGSEVREEEIDGVTVRSFIGIPAGFAASSAYANGFIREYAITQNRLVTAFRHGHQVSTTIDKLPITPGAIFHVNHSGSMASYRVNGLNVVFDNRQCLVSVDALYWGAAG